MIKAVIFDLNGVFVRSRFLSDRFQKTYKIATDVFWPAMKEIMHIVRQPNAGSSWQYWEPLMKEWGITITEQEFWDFWFTGEKEVPEMIELAKRLKGDGMRIFILSNNFVERAAYYQKHFSFMTDVIDHVYYSWQTGLVKPNPEAWKKVLTENSLEPSEVLYFDDVQTNIDVAQELGITSHIFLGAEDVEQKLKENKLQ